MERRNALWTSLRNGSETRARLEVCLENPFVIYGIRSCARGPEWNEARLTEQEVTWTRWRTFRSFLNASIPPTKTCTGLLNRFINHAPKSSDARHAVFGANKILVSGRPRVLLPLTYCSLEARVAEGLQFADDEPIGAKTQRKDQGSEREGKKIRAG